MKPQQASLFELNAPLPTPTSGEIDPWHLRIDNAIPPHTDFVDSVRRFGVIQPIITATVVCQDEEKGEGGGEVHVIQGRRRTLAARMIGLKAIEEKRYALKDWGQFDVLLLMLQHQHHANPAAEYFAAFRLLQGGATAAHIHAVTGVEPGQLKKLMRLGELHADLLQAFKDGKITIGQAFQCAKLSMELQCRLVQEIRHGTRISNKLIQAIKSERRNTAMAVLMSSPLVAALHAEAKSTTFEDLANRLTTPVIGQILHELAGDPRFIQVASIFAACQLARLQQSKIKRGGEVNM